MKTNIKIIFIALFMFFINFIIPDLKPAEAINTISYTYDIPIYSNYTTSTSSDIITYWTYTPPLGGTISETKLTITASDTSCYHTMFYVCVDNNTVGYFDEYQHNGDRDPHVYSLKDLSATSLSLKINSNNHYLYFKVYGTVTISYSLPGGITETYALNAQNNTNAAKISADAAKSEATASKNMLNGSSNGGKSLAATYDKAGAAAGDATYIRNTQLPGLQNQIANLETTINNMTSGDTTPPNFVDLRTKSGARATSGSAVQLVVDATDNVSSILQYSVDGGSFQALSPNRIITARVGSGPIVTISVTVKDETGNESSKSISIRKL
ncbi:hypothetical protein [Desulfoscipio gibsoniae]